MCRLDLWVISSESLKETPARTTPFKDSFCKVLFHMIMQIYFILGRQHKKFLSQRPFQQYSLHPHAESVHVYDTMSKGASQTT